jgi:NifU-like protein involved in Fe-S cluster formation
LFLIISCNISDKNIILASIEEQKDTTSKYNEQVQKVEYINQKVDSVKLKWENIEKAIQEKQQKPK